MGSLFSKKRSKEGGSSKTKKRAGKNNPRNVGSTASLNLPSVEVSFSPDTNTYDKAHHGQTLPRNQDQTHPSVEMRDQMPPVPDRPQDRHSRIQSQSLVDLPSQTSQNIGPPPMPPPHNRPAENRRKTSSPEEEHDYLEEKKGKEKVPSNNLYYAPQTCSKQKVRADKNYEANYEHDISFRRGDILQFINEQEENGWYYMRNLTSKDEGYVHKDWVTIITSGDVESQKFFFKELDRAKAEEKLLESHVSLGTYLVRPGADGYALSLRCHNDLYEDEIRHYKVRILEKGICYIEADSSNRPFGNITELINYYTEKPGLRCRLKTPLPPDIPLDDIAVKFSDLKLGVKLGSGNFGSVYAGTLHTNKEVAVKSLKAGGSMTFEEFRKEAETMHTLRHPNLVSLLAICEDNNKIYIITERMSKGALLNLLRGDTEYGIIFKDLMHMAIQVLDGMCYMEKKGFVHRDLRAANVLVGDENITKIADFGMARLLDQYYAHEDSYEEKKGAAFPIKWTAPEAAKKLRFTVKSDVWSFGILLYEMVTYGDEPYAGVLGHDILRWLEQGNRLERPSKHYCPVTLYNIMTSCWLRNSNERPTFANIKETLAEIIPK